MMSRIDEGVISSAIYRAFCPPSKEEPTSRTTFQKGVVYALVARHVANFNPMYALFYGAVRGVSDYAMEKNLANYLRAWRNIDVDRSSKLLSKTAYIAFNLFLTVGALYTVCKVGELFYWGGSSLIGRASCRPFRLSALVKIEGWTLMTSTVIPLAIEKFSKKS